MGERELLLAAATILRQRAAGMPWTPLRWLYRRRLRAAAVALGEHAGPHTSDEIGADQ